MLCPYCGKEASFPYCRHCGANIPRNEAVVAPAVDIPAPDTSIIKEHMEDKIVKPEKNPLAFLGDIVSELPAPHTVLPTSTPFKEISNTPNTPQVVSNEDPNWPQEPQRPVQPTYPEPEPYREPRAYQPPQLTAPPATNPPWGTSIVPAKDKLRGGAALFRGINILTMVLWSLLLAAFSLLFIATVSTPLSYVEDPTFFLSGSPVLYISVIELVVVLMFIINIVTLVGIKNRKRFSFTTFLLHMSFFIFMFGSLAALITQFVFWLQYDYAYVQNFQVVNIETVLTWMALAYAVLFFYWVYLLSSKNIKTYFPKKEDRYMQNE